MIWLFGFIYGLFHWGNLAWRHPDKLKEWAVRTYSSNAYVWSVRIITLVMALALLAASFFLIRSIF